MMNVVFCAKNSVIIFNELCCGVIKDSSKTAYKDIIAKLRDRGDEAVILGCTEIGLLIKQEASTLEAMMCIFLQMIKRNSFLELTMRRLSRA